MLKPFGEHFGLYAVCGGGKGRPELVYMASLRGEKEIAEENAKLCQDFLKSDTLTAKRILVAWSKMSGQTEFVDALLVQAEDCLQNERVAGVKKFEQILLSRMER